MLEGFSGEEGGVDMFGTTEFDGQSRYGEVPVQADGSFAAVVPGNVPFHIQLIDKFGMSLANESIWISGRAGEQRFCGGCHENRTKAASIAPGITQANVSRAPSTWRRRAPQRVSTTAYLLTGGNLTNAARRATTASAASPGTWRSSRSSTPSARAATTATPGAGNPSYTVTDNDHGPSQTFIFDLRGQKLNVTIGERATGDFTASYLSLMGLGEILSDADVTVRSPAPPKQYVEPASAMNSLVIQMLNPMQRFPTVDTERPRLRRTAAHRRRHQPRRRRGRPGAHRGRVLPPHPQHRHGWSVLLPGEPEHRWLGDPVTEKTTCTRTRQ